MKLALLHTTEPIPREWLDLVVGAVHGVIRAEILGSPWEIEIVFDVRDSEDLRRIELSAAGGTVTVGDESGLLIRGRISTLDHWLCFKTALIPENGESLAPRRLMPIFVSAVDENVDPLAARIFCAN